MAVVLPQREMLGACALGAAFALPRTIVIGGIAVRISATKAHELSVLLVIVGIIGKDSPQRAHR